MNMFFVLAIGGILGWITSLMVRDDDRPDGGLPARHRVRLNIAAGTLGALLAGMVILPGLGGTPLTSADPGIGAVMGSLGGALLLLAIVNAVRRGSPR
ncbi:MAG TPA: GlsB/YeaQ/YmgE family stress response membrane protein [Novosphingobium sp.]|nr:GlsB/YeaQ/YmgE family stress response membrane protein [Novosphingobium sp.]HQN53525.1 GlsB/YeaQ/YmgE family stress response membrane protein [Novosphingobium sp.]